MINATGRSNFWQSGRTWRVLIATPMRRVPIIRMCAVQLKGGCIGVTISIMSLFNTLKFPGTDYEQLE